MTTQHQKAFRVFGRDARLTRRSDFSFNFNILPSLSAVTTFDRLITSLLKIPLKSAVLIPEIQIKSFRNQKNYVSLWKKKKTEKKLS